MKIKKLFKILKEKIKLRTLILLILVLSFNTFAWFIYATKVSGGLSAHISSWNIEFKAGDGQTTTNIDFDVDKIYPGMDTYTKEVTVKNDGEVEATLSYKINKIVVLGQTYQIDSNTTSDNLLNMLENNFPFKININTVNGTELQQNSTSTFSISVNWPYESGNDELDTTWGENAYQYYQQNPEGTSLHIEIELSAMQH